MSGENGNLCHTTVKWPKKPIKLATSLLEMKHLKIISMFKWISWRALRRKTTTFLKLEAKRKDFQFHENIST